MAVQSEIFSTEYGVRSFISTKHIATKQHMAVWLQRKEDSIWVQLSTSNYELINNSAVLISSPNSTIYSQVEIRVADTPDELGTSQSEISIVAGLYDEIVALNGIKNDITTVASNTTNISTVSNNTENINSVVTNIVPNLTEILQADANATTATTKASEASASATSASNSATTATNQATIATTKASEASASATSASNSATTATTKANEASASATSANNSAISASNSANTATTKANEASSSASSASTSATTATTQAGIATTQAVLAQGYASSIDASNLVHKTGDETIAGVKTFSSSPIVPTPTVGDNSKKIATTEFVLANATTPDATETTKGKVELATSAEVQAGVDDLRAVTPLKLFNSLKGSNQNLAESGYQKLHGGLIIQWGSALNHTSQGQTFTFPIAFPNKCISVLTTDGASSALNVTSMGVQPYNSYFNLYGVKGTTAAVAGEFSYMAIGY